MISVTGTNWLIDRNAQVVIGQPNGPPVILDVVLSTLVSWYGTPLRRAANKGSSGLATQRKDSASNNEEAGEREVVDGGGGKPGPGIISTRTPEESNAGISPAITRYVRATNFVSQINVGLESYIDLLFEKKGKYYLIK